MFGISSYDTIMLTIMVNMDRFRCRTLSEKEPQDLSDLESWSGRKEDATPLLFVIGVVALKRLVSDRHGIDIANRSKVIVLDAPDVLDRVGVDVFDARRKSSGHWQTQEIVDIRKFNDDIADTSFGVSSAVIHHYKKPKSEDEETPCWVQELIRITLEDVEDDDCYNECYDIIVYRLAGRTSAKVFRKEARRLVECGADEERVDKLVQYINRADPAMALRKAYVSVYKGNSTKRASKKYDACKRSLDFLVDPDTGVPISDPADTFYINVPAKK